MILTETPCQQLYHSDKNKKKYGIYFIECQEIHIANIICLIYVPDRSVVKYTPRFTEWNCCQFLNLLSSILGNMASNVSLGLEQRGTSLTIPRNGQSPWFLRSVAESLYIQKLSLCSSVGFMMSLTIHALRVCDL